MFHADERTDGQADRTDRTDMTKEIVAFRNFANAPKNGQEHATSRSGAIVPLTLAPEIDFFAHSYILYCLCSLNGVNN